MNFGYKGCSNVGSSVLTNIPLWCEMLIIGVILYLYGDRRIAETSSASEGWRMGAVNLRKKVNIKQDTKTLILITGWGLTVSGTKSPASRNHTAFIVLFRIMSSEEGAVGGGCRVFYYFISSFIILKVT